MSSSGSQVTPGETNKLHVAWVDDSNLPSTTSDEIGSLSSKQQKQKDPSTSVSRPWPSTSCASNVTANPIYVNSVASKNTITTTAIVHTKDPKSSGEKVAESDFGRTDSDSDAQIDSMSSSDLEHCEELDNFELSPTSSVPSESSPLAAASKELCPSAAAPSDLSPRLNAQNDLPQTSSAKTQNYSSSVATDNGEATYSGDSWTSGEVQVMSLRDFENLPPMWEDGGSVDTVGVDLGGSQWQMIRNDESAKVFHEGWDKGGDDHDDNGNETESFVDREEDIEQTLRNIYVSPFQDHHHPAPATSGHAQNRSRRQNKWEISTTTITNTNNHKSKSVAINHKVRLDDKAHSADNDVDTDEGDFDDAVMLCPRGPVEEYASSLARVAEKAVSGYRTCDDIESYVATRKPRLILARAPPTPSGILRRRNRKVAEKAPPSGVHWADGRTSNPRPADDVT